MKINKINKAFTLIEMLVVISIIGILSALALASYTGTQKQARDAQRKSDLKQYQTTLEQYANSTDGLYPSYTSAVTLAEGANLCNDLSMSFCPEDPKNVSPYIYRYISDGSGSGTDDATEYSFWTAIERETSTYWVVCSDGSIGESATAPSGGSICPL